MKLLSTTGQPSPLLWALAFVFLAWAFFFGGRAVWSFVMTVRENWRSSESSTTSSSGTKIPPGFAAHTAKNLKTVITSLAILTVGWALGWLWRDSQLLSRSHTFTRVWVEDRYNDRSFLLRPAGLGRAYKFDFDRGQDFVPGQILAALNYEQLVGHKHLRYAYSCPEFCDVNGTPILYRKEAYEHESSR